MTVVALTARNGKELRVSEDAVEFWLERGYKRVPAPVKATEKPPVRKTTKK